MPKNNKLKRGSRRSSNRGVSPELVQAAEFLFAAHSPNDELDLDKDMPNRINPAAENLWREVLSTHGDRINKEGGEQAGSADYPGVSKFILRAALALTIFARACREHGIDPFTETAVTQPVEDVQQNIPISESEDAFGDEGEDEGGEEGDIGQYEQLILDWFAENPDPISASKLMNSLNETAEEGEEWTIAELLETAEGLDGYEVKRRKPQRASLITPPAEEVEEVEEDETAVEPGDVRWHEDDDYADLELEDREVEDEHILSDEYFGLSDEDFEIGTDPDSLTDIKSRDPHWKTEDPGEGTDFFAPKGLAQPEDEEYEDEAASTYAYLRWYVGGSGGGVRDARREVLKMVRKVLKNPKLQLVNSQGRLNRMDAPDVRQDRVRFIPGGFNPLDNEESDPAYKIRFFQNLVAKPGSKVELELTSAQIKALVKRLRSSGGLWKYPYVNERNQKSFNAIKFVAVDDEGAEHVKLDLFLQFFESEEDEDKFTVSLFYAFLIEEADAAALVGFSGPKFADGDNRPNQRVMQALSKYALSWSRQGYPPEMEDQSDMFKQRRGPKAARRRGRKKQASVQGSSKSRNLKLAGRR